MVDELARLRPARAPLDPAQAAPARGRPPPRRPTTSGRSCARIPTVVTIHDCIHLLFPQYLPNRMAFRYARFMMGDAVRRSALVFTVSEASRDDILRFYPATDPEKVQRRPERDRRGAARAPRRRTRWSGCASATRCAAASCSTPATSSRTRTSSA